MSPRLPVVVVAALAIIACSDGTGPKSQVTLEQIAGNWDLSRVEMLLAADTTVHHNVTAGLGVAVSLRISRDGGATLILSGAGQTPDTSYATISLQGDTLDFRANGSSYRVVVKLAGRTMSWRALDTTSWDVDADGSPEDVYELDTWQRP